MRSAFRDLKLSLAKRTLREQQRNHYLEILFVHTRRHRLILKSTDRNKLELAGDQWFLIAIEISGKKRVEPGRSIS
jgi:hypothetical protein